MRIPLAIAQLTPEEAYRRGRQDRIWGWTWRVTMLVLALVGLTTLVSNFGIFLLACMGYDLATIEGWK